MVKDEAVRYALDVPDRVRGKQSTERSKGELGKTGSR
jgi:hypothetical protein